MIIIDESNAEYRRHGFIGGFYIRPMGPFRKGDLVQGHKHVIDHLTSLVSGAVRVIITDKEPIDDHELIEEYELHVPCKIEIKADLFHRFEVLEDNTYWECIFSEAEAEKVLGDSRLADWTV